MRPLLALWDVAIGFDLDACGRGPVDAGRCQAGLATRAHTLSGRWWSECHAAASGLARLRLWTIANVTASPRLRVKV